MSIRFNVDGYEQKPKTGRLVGSLGPYLPGEPSRFVAGRALQPTDDDHYPAYAQLDGNVLAIDLGNSLQTEKPGGGFKEKGPLSVVLLPPKEDPIPIGTVTPADPWFSQTAGVATFQLDPATRAKAESTPIGVLVPGSDGSSKKVLAESPSGVWVRADDFVFRLSPGYRTKSKFYARRFGKPLKAVIVLGYNATNMAGQTTQGPIPGPATVGEPTSALAFPQTLETGDDGTAVLTIQAGNPGNPRTYIDGQVYGIAYAAFSQSSPPDLTVPVTNASLILNVLLWTNYEIPSVPTWVNDVRPIFQQFADLYPVMKPIVDLSSYEDVVAKRAKIKYVFNLPITNPGYMPVTRDLSDAKRLDDPQVARQSTLRAPGRSPRRRVNGIGTGTWSDIVIRRAPGDELRRAQPDAPVRNSTWECIRCRLGESFSHGHCSRPRCPHPRRHALRPGVAARHR